MYQELQDILKEQGFGGKIYIDEERLQSYATDESIFSVMPQMVVVPKDEADVQLLVQTVNHYKTEHETQARDLSLTVRAAGTGLSGGSLNDSIIVDVANFTDLDMTQEDENQAAINAGPGVYFRDISSMAEQAGYYFPPYPSSRDICTISGMVANNAAGPNSLRYGHTADFVDAVTMVMADGSVHVARKINYQQLQEIIDGQGFVADLYRQVWQMLDEESEQIMIQRENPASSKNTAGYNVWNVLNAESLEAFRAGEGTFSLVPVVCGSQGTLGIITAVSLRVIKKPVQSPLLTIPVYDIDSLGSVVETLLKHDPYNIELFDGRTFKLALRHPLFFKNFYTQVGDSTELSWPLFSFWLYKNYLLNLKRGIPELLLMVKFDGTSQADVMKKLQAAAHEMSQSGNSSRVITNKAEELMYWRVRGSSYSLAKLGVENQRPAAFLEDMVVAPDQMGAFLKELKHLLAEYQVGYALHGHGGNGHFHFYPLMDFTDPHTPEKILSMADSFFTLAKKHGGNICGEHNDGIMRTPYHHLLFSPEGIALFEKLERAFDPLDIFNPGKKVNPRFDIKNSIRKTN